MNRRPLRSAFGAAILVAALAGSSAAQADWPWPQTHHYRFHPELSTLHQTGGFAGVDERYRIRGTFDLVIEPSLLAIWPPIFTARFDEVDASFGSRTQPEPTPIDLALNLSELAGATRYRGPNNVFHFQGRTLDDSTIVLHGAILGRWFYLRGETTPPPGASDFFEYRVRAVARRLPSGDFNDDGVVDAADLVHWSTLSERSGADLLAWQRELGEPLPTLESLDAALDAAIAEAAAGVPEPAAATLAAAAGGIGLAATRRRRRRSTAGYR